MPKKAERREEMLRVASEVFAATGYHAARMDDIAAAANVAKGTLYLYFDDKRAIFSELIDGLSARLSAAIIRVDTEGDVAAQVKHNIRAVLGVLVEQPELMRMLFDQASGVDKEFRKKMDSFYRALKHLLATSLEDGQALGIVRAGDAELYASLTIGALREILVEAASRPSGRTREQVVDAIFDVLEGGYLRLAGEGGKRGRRVVAVLEHASKNAGEAKETDSSERRAQRPRRSPSPRQDGTNGRRRGS
jgi:AcrR family transcriptional regulator